MDSIEYTTRVPVQESSSSCVKDDDRLEKLRRVAAELRALGSDVARIETAVVDALIRELHCERGVLLYFEGARDDGDGSRLVARSRVLETTGGGDGAIRDDADGEFSLHHPTIKKAVSEFRPLLVKDSLVEPPKEGIEVHHSVLCYPFRFSTDRVGVIYLARSVGEASFREEELELVEDFALVCLPTLQNGALADELRRVESRRGADTSTEQAETDDGESAWSDTDGEIPSFHGIVGRSQRLEKIFELVDKIKDTDFNVCIIGESGTGKELLARAIHECGKRRGGRFISENCGAISETLLESELFGYVKGAFTGADENRKGLFELADGGTLFLDEIADMSEGMQRKLLRVLQEGVIRPIGSKSVVEVDVRVICASNRDLRLLVESGTFRADLYYRLNVISLELPPLRERLEDVPLLVRHILENIRAEDGGTRKLSESAMKALMAYSWPGNIRELMNVLRRVMVTGTRRLVTRKEILPLLSGGPARSYVGEGADEIDNQIVLRIPRRMTFNEIISECEKAVLLNALKENRWNKSRVTKVLKIPRQSLYNKIAKYDLKRD